LPSDQTRRGIALQRAPIHSLDSVRITHGLRTSGPSTCVDRRATSPTASLNT